MSEDQHVTVLPGVGPSLAEKLKRLGIVTVQDLLFLLPLRYEDRTRIVPIGGLRKGVRAVIEGEIQLAEVVFRGRRSLLVNLADGTGGITLRFFYFTRAQQNNLVRGARLRCFGEVRHGSAGLEIVHPEYRMLTPDKETTVEQSLTPVYPATEGVQQGRLRRLTDLALQRLATKGIREWLPDDVLARLRLPTLQEALGFVHRPPPDAPLEDLATGTHPAQRRLAFEELLAHHLSLRRLRRRIQSDPARALDVNETLSERFENSLPFRLTDAQRRVSDEIRADLERPVPMLRLVQGDVGSGKTVVAALAVAKTVASGYQAALMAPTELLAEQHFQNLSRWFEPLEVTVERLSGQVKGAARKRSLERIATGDASLVVGTHALFQEAVDFRDLALLIVDEQHRFGVHQRLALREKGVGRGFHPHQLIMTATPIPRTLAMTAYADLDTSVVDELPPGRTPVTTVAMPDSRRGELIERVRGYCGERGQVYWVCPLIDESETLDVQAAEDIAGTLTDVLPELSVGLVHGRMTPAQKDRVMSRFKKGDVDVLVATTVIEVGVDVPNASLMVIENAERLGLAQLHQLRGRVGRGSESSSCVLLYKAPLSEPARIRLAVLRDTNDGFEVARKDLELRGPGEVLGTRQTGLVQMRVADLVRDADLLPTVHRAAGILTTKYPETEDPLIRRWIGGAHEYGKV